MFHRLLNISESNSFFLFGARGTGKTSLIHHHLKSSQVAEFDLLDDHIVRKFRKDPASLSREIAATEPAGKPDWVFIDEAQRAPQLLGIVQKMIEKEKMKFALTGSSARKLKRGMANLLAGRAFVYHLFPLTFLELGDQFNLQRVLSFGSLPKVTSLTSNSDKIAFLRAYALTYVREEVVAEQLIRQLDPFNDFLEVSAQMSSKIINQKKIAGEVGVDPKTVAKYFDILEHTWMGFRLPGFHRSIRKAQRISPKFYWFDLGVRRALENTLEFEPAPGTSYYGECFEELVINEAFRLNHYSTKHFRMSYLETLNSQTEVDLVLERGRGKDLILIQIKSAAKIDPEIATKLSHLGKSMPEARLYYLSQTTTAQVIDGVRCMPWQLGLREIFAV